MQIVTKLYTVFLLIGPSGSGKSKLTKEFMLPQLENELHKHHIRPNIHHLSEDEIKQTLLGKFKIYSSRDSRMDEVSIQAANMLKTQLEALLSFPINAHFVIIDTSDMSKEFRTGVIDISRKHNYNVDAIIFNFKRIQDFYFSNSNSRLTKSHVEILRNSVLPNVGNFDNQYYVTQRDISFEFTVDGLKTYKKYILDPTKKYFIIGDVNECIDELKQLIRQYGFEINKDGIIYQTDDTNNTEIILTGNIIDIGNLTEETIDFIHKNLLRSNILKIVMGQNEHIVLKLLQGEKSESKYPDGYLEKYHNSYIKMKTNLPLAKKFIDICDLSVPFYVFNSENESKSFYISHAICPNKCLGKLNKQSLKSKRFLFLDKTRDLRSNINDLLDKNSINYPLHIVGHTPVSEPYLGTRDTNNINNKIIINTGCIYGNKLTGVLLGNEIEIPKFWTIKFMEFQNASVPDTNNKSLHVLSSNEQLDEIPKNNKHIKSIDKSFKKVDIKGKLQSFDSNKINKLNYLINNRINHLSGSVAPADTDNKEIESIVSAIKYYYQKFNELKIDMKLSIQPRYFGTHVNVYLLLDDLESTYTVSSRNSGQKIYFEKNISDKLYLQLFEKYRDLIVQNGISLLVLDGVLLPWDALGKTEHEKVCNVLDVGMSSECSFLRRVGFEKQYETLVKTMKQLKFSEDLNKLQKKQMTNKYNHDEYLTYKNLMIETQSHKELSDIERNAKLHHEQLDLQASSNTTPYFKMFGILKVIFTTGKEVIPGIYGPTFTNMKWQNKELTQSTIFSIVGDDEQHIINFTKGLNICIDEAKIYFNKITIKDKLSGVIVKPDMIIPAICPCFQVRSLDHLTLIYGPDYRQESKYQYLIKKKDTKKNIDTSIKEFNLGLKMLSQNYTDITVQNNEYINHTTELI